MTDELARLAAEWRALGGADRRAIERRLSPSERAMLRGALADRNARPTPGGKSDLSPYSPWLAAVLARIGAGGAAPDAPAPTAAARALLSVLLERADRARA